MNPYDCKFDDNFGYSNLWNEPSSFVRYGDYSESPSIGGHRQPITKEQRTHRKTRRALAKNSRRANRKK